MRLAKLCSHKIPSYFLDSPSVNGTLCAPDGEFTAMTLEDKAWHMGFWQIMASLGNSACHPVFSFLTDV
eukprot:1327024-Amphidinium_carterae.3